MWLKEALVPVLSAKAPLLIPANVPSETLQPGSLNQNRILLFLLTYSNSNVNNHFLFFYLLDEYLLRRYLLSSGRELLDCLMMMNPFGSVLVDLRS